MSWRDVVNLSYDPDFRGFAVVMGLAVVMLLTWVFGTPKGLRELFNGPDDASEADDSEPS